MRNTKLYAVLEYFDKKEQSRLRKYLLSPYFNMNEDLVQLFEVVIKQINAKNEKAFEKNAVWKELTGKKQYNDVRFRKYMSDLLKLIEGFLGQEVYEKEPLLQATNLLKAVEAKKLTRISNSTLRAARRLSEQMKHRGAGYFYYKYLIELFYDKLMNFDKKRNIETFNEKEIIQNLDFFYFTEKLRIHSSVLSNQYLVKREMESFFFDKVIEYVRQHKFKQVPAIMIYYQIYLIQVDSEDEDHFFKLKDLLNQHYSLFLPNQAYDMYTFAINYCIRKSNAGAPQFLKELFVLYKEILQKDHIVSNIEFSPWRFKNIVMVGLRFKEYEWVEFFIQKYQSYLLSFFRKNAVTYNLAQLYFYQKKYDEVIQKLRDVEFEDFSYNLNSKAILLATYYETDEIDPLYFLFESFRTFLNRHKKIPAARRQNYLNLIKFTKKLTKLKPKDKNGLQKIKAEVAVTKNIASRNWLLEKIEVLEK